ncbi:MAG TPA: MauE/DoxX family redox-associated membrane protein [Candidatus Methylomirabilis sp.]|nr:MauE/DoxX family redox-associated membrane protein [Candidatus Methylomirabilis sp.]
MMQSSPLNFRRVVIWIGRLVLGGIFIYAGYSKAFLPNTNFWPYFILKFSLAMNLSNFATQVAAFKLLPAWGVQFVAHTLPFTEILLGVLVLIGWRLRIWASLLTLIMLGFFVVVTRAYLLHMDINCGCFATPEPINLKKVLEDAALSALAIAMTILAFAEARQPHPWAAPEKASVS